MSARPSDRPGFWNRCVFRTTLSHGTQVQCKRRAAWGSTLCMQHLKAVSALASPTPTPRDQEGE